jgi:hypothetical protein
MGNTISNTSAPAARRSSEPSAADKANAWKGELNTALTPRGEDTPELQEGTLEYLGEGRLDKMKDRVTEDMETFVRDNPNASLSDIKEKGKEVAVKHKTEAVLEKMRDDRFFKKLMDRRKELIKDMWG